MAKFIENDKNKFPNAIIGKSNFLSSLRDFKEEGAKCGIENISRVFASAQNPKLAMISVEITIMDDIPKLRCYKLDDDGEYIEKMDELTGEKTREIELKSISADDLESFPMFMKCGQPTEISNEADLTFYPTSSAYPLFKLALTEAGELPVDMGDKAFVTNQEELKEALEGFEFIAKCEEIKGKFNYLRMKCEAV